MSLSGIGRRSLLGAVLGTVGRAAAQPVVDVVELWPGGVPGGAPALGAERVSEKGAVSGVSRPRMKVHRPARANGAAVVVMAGGGYVRIEAGAESTPACQWLASIGVTAFELIYRLPADGWPAVAPFQDAQRAMRMVRGGAFGVDPGRIGVIGFSAGGHLAGMTSVRPGAALYAAVDGRDAVPARPDFAGLVYPVLSMMPPVDHTRSRREIVGENPSAAESAAWSVERLVTAETPPVFLAQAADDPISPVDNSLLMFGALRAAHVAAEVHVFQAGGHGWGLGRAGTEERAWPGLFQAWAVVNRFLPVAAGNG